jgi:hypothetical protein
MLISPFAAVGSLLAGGPGILLLAALAASIVLVWDWRWALGSTLALLLGISSITAAIHGPTVLVTFSQWLAIVFAGLLLGLSARFHRASAARYANSNWLLRLIALGFVLGAWWVLDPGVTLPLFSQVETDIVIWIGLCGLLLLGLSSAPFHVGIGLLLLTAPLQAMAPVLLTGSGLAVIVGIAQIMVALACAYLTLVQTLPVRRERRLDLALAHSMPTSPTPSAPTPSAPTILASPLRRFLPITAKRQPMPEVDSPDAADVLDAPAPEKRL